MSRSILYARQILTGIIGENAVNIGQHYFHDEDLSEENYHNVVKIEDFPDFSIKL